MLLWVWNPGKPNKSVVWAQTGFPSPSFLHPVRKPWNRFLLFVGFPARLSLQDTEGSDIWWWLSVSQLQQDMNACEGGSARVQGQLLNTIKNDLCKTSASSFNCLLSFSSWHSKNNINQQKDKHSKTPPPMPPDPTNSSELHFLVDPWWIGELTNLFQGHFTNL